MLRLCYAPKSLTDSPQKPQRMVEPQYVEGQVAENLICFKAFKTPRSTYWSSTPPLVDFSRALPLSLF